MLSLLALFPARNGLASLVPSLVVVGVGWALLRGTAMAQATVAAGVVWFLLISGAVDTFRLPSRGGDAANLAEKTLIPGFLWKLLWIAIGLAALVAGTRLLLTPTEGA